MAKKPRLSAEDMRSEAEIIANSQRDPLAPVTLTDEQEEAWEVSKALLVSATPAFSEIFYRLLTFGDHLALFTLGVPTAATDGSVLLLNPEAFFPFEPGERLFITSHEILHVALEHNLIMHALQQANRVTYPDGVELPYDHMLGNIAADYVVNAILVEGRIGKYRKDWYYDPNVATSADSFLDTYRKLYLQHPPPPGGHTKPCKPGPGPNPNQPQPTGKPVQGPQPQSPPPAPKPSPPLPGARQGQSGFDEHLKPGTVKKQPPAQAAAEASGPKHRRVIEQALDSARQQGLLPGSIERAFQKVLEPDVDWTQALATTVSRRIGNDRWNYEMSDQEWMSRDIYVPSRSSFGCADLVVGGDVSGSVSDEETALFLGCMVGILEQLRPRRLFVVWCDAQVQRVDEISAPGELFTLKGPGGGGGTDFRPVFEWIRQRPDLDLDGLIYLTDGQGTHVSTPPHFPVIWGNVYPNAKYPFGDVVNVPRKGTSRRRW